MPRLYVLCGVILKSAHFPVFKTIYDENNDDDHDGGWMVGKGVVAGSVMVVYAAASAVLLLQYKVKITKFLASTLGKNFQGV